MERFQKELTRDQERILHACGTEPPFSGKLLYNKEQGAYLCAGCGAALFTSDVKFDSGTGWPSFFQPVSAEAIEEQRDESHGLARIEVRCNACKGHLGHVFEDGPRPTGLRYCINSAALEFEKN